MFPRCIRHVTPLNIENTCKQRQTIHDAVLKLPQKHALLLEKLIDSAGHARERRTQLPEFSRNIDLGKECPDVASFTTMHRPHDRANRSMDQDMSRDPCTCNGKEGCNRCKVEAAHVGILGLRQCDVTSNCDGREQTKGDFLDRSKCNNLVTPIEISGIDHSSRCRCELGENVLGGLFGLLELTRNGENY